MRRGMSNGGRGEGRISMKHQYFGDINDYRKYGLLRCIAEATGQALGVLWLLTEDDGRTDGEFRRYLQHPTRWRGHDPLLFEALSQLLQVDHVRHVAHASAWDLLPGATYFDHVFTDSATERSSAMTQAAERLGGCPILFVDPDNGIEIKSVKYGSKNSCKYVYWRELDALFRNGHTLLIYQHYPRIARERFHAELSEALRRQLGAADVLVFSTPYVAFFLALQPRHVAFVPSIRALVENRWRQQIRCTSHGP